MVSLLLLCLFFIKCVSNQNSIEFYPLLPSKFSNSSEGNRPVSRNDYYVVKNFEINNQENKKSLDSFVVKNLPDTIEKYTTYQMLFYRYKRNKIDKNFKHNSSDNLIEWYGEYLVAEYLWQNGKYSYKTIRFPNGDIKSDFTQLR